MIINIFEKPFSKTEFKKFDDNVDFTNGKINNYNAIINDDMILINSEWYNSDETTTTALYNKSSDIKTSNNYIEIDNVICKNIPTFGVTLEDNFNILQFNLTREEVNNSNVMSSIIKHRGCLMFWDTNKKYNYSSKEIDENKLKELVAIYKKQGYIAPLVLYADKDFIRPYYHDYIIYLYKVLNLDILPVRIITYKDIRYIKNIDELIYNKIKSIQSNKYYEAVDNEDMSPYMISNYSNKRDIIKKYLNGQFNNLQFDDLHEFLPYVFNDEKENLNKNLITNVMNHDFSKYFYLKNGKQFYSMSLSESLFNYLNGHLDTKEISITEDQIIKKFPKFEIKKIIDFDPSLLALDYFDYNINNEIIGEISKQFGRNCLYEESPNALIDFHVLNDLLNGSETKIKILKIKK